MESSASIDAVAGVIQSAVAPVFLLVGLSGLLNTLSVRLGRIIDRKRVVDSGLNRSTPGCTQALMHEARLLRRRIRLVNWSIRLCVGSALVVCLVVVALFVGAAAPMGLGGVIASLFMTAMLLVIGGLLFLLMEVGVAASQARDGSENCVHLQPPGG